VGAFASREPPTHPDNRRTTRAAPAVVVMLVVRFMAQPRMQYGVLSDRLAYDISSTRRAVTAPIIERA